ncbi:hypothetical protein SBOR_0480 [Sclerotinia borealis F-4128]|uniref:Ecp2 effector protein domain-containing protein n=1 Tax=Sclerotinia borealis (strain F-4128) TaxID=1432307 RepID=W9CWV7_SCLBF|nr:hypothetical protein SBOR_0480 [Sclerotinia borealis F-4128]
MIFHKILFLAFASHVLSAIVLERGTKSLLSSSSSSSTSTTLPNATNTTNGDFSSSALAATATCGSGNLPRAATKRARSMLQSNTTGTCATILPGWPCFGTGIQGSDDSFSGLTSSFRPTVYYGTIAFLCNLGEGPMGTTGLDVEFLDGLIFQKHCANFTPAVLVSEGEWAYGFLDVKTVGAVGQGRELCSLVMSGVVAYPEPME